MHVEFRLRIPLRRRVVDSFASPPADGGQQQKLHKGAGSMLDIVLIGIGILFFALSFAYTKACDRL